MRLEQIADKAIDFVRENTHPHPQLCYIKNLGEVWSCVYRGASPKPNEPFIEVLLWDKDGSIVGFRKFKSFEPMPE